MIRLFFTTSVFLFSISIPKIQILEEMPARLLRSALAFPPFPNTTFFPTYFFFSLKAIYLSFLFCIFLIPLTTTFSLISSSFSFLGISLVVVTSRHPRILPKGSLGGASSGSSRHAHCSSPSSPLYSSRGSTPAHPLPLPCPSNLTGWLGWLGFQPPAPDTTLYSHSCLFL